MYPLQFLLALVPTVTAVALPAAQQPAQHHRCSTPDPSTEIIAQHNAAYQAYRNGTFHVDATTDIIIPTYVHVVTTDEKQGKYTPAMINKQMALLNARFKSMGVAFQLAKAEYVTNDEWARASPGTQAERNMRTFLQSAIGRYDSLNLYFLSDIGAETSEPGLLGFCRFPVANPTYNDYLLDGCLNGAESLPGGGSTYYGLGYTAAHEIGHWFDLYHVFMGQSCFGSGDFVNDTPAQRTATDGCPSGKDSCPDHPGLDSIHNIMDYSYDYCLTHFSTDQGERARVAFDQYRYRK